VIPLPERHTDLINAVKDRKCRRCNTVPREPALCLVCGELLCAAQLCCAVNERGELNMHTHSSCGCAFILPNTAVVLMLRSDLHHGQFYPCPYLDEFGEEDSGFTRGRPLFLDRSRFQQLTKLIADHAVDAFVSSNTEQPGMLRRFVWSLF
jgi:hypothetical protein